MKNSRHGTCYSTNLSYTPLEHLRNVSSSATTVPSLEKVDFLELQNGTQTKFPACSFCGYTDVVKVKESKDDKKVPSLRYIKLLDQPGGGACALNTNSLRLLLHKKQLPFTLI